MVDTLLSVDSIPEGRFLLLPFPSISYSVSFALLRRSSGPGSASALFSHLATTVHDWFYDSPPSKPVMFSLTNGSWLLDTR